MGLLYEGSEWTFDGLERVTDACHEIAVGEMGYDIYANQIEVISSEQMLDVYSSSGLPISYRHWSFGKRFSYHQGAYRKGMQGLAYEVVINSDPCISYIMEENTMTMQTLVIAHAAFGHNTFFKTNSHFRQFTDASGILDYLDWAKRYVASCEDKHGIAAVERILDAAHALQGQGVDRYSRKTRRLSDEKARIERRLADEAASHDQLWRTLPGGAPKALAAEDPQERLKRIELPEANVLYFIEKNSPKLKPWERELVRIVRTIAQYFLPQPSNKTNNEGCATFTHMEIMTKLNDRGRISNGAYQEFLISHGNVVRQLDYDHPAFNGWNPYALGYAIMEDVKRICLEPTEEDARWFPAFAGNQDPYGTLRRAWSDHRDDGLIHNYLSPKVMRDFRMFHVGDAAGGRFQIVENIHDELGFRAMRRKLAQIYDPGREPDINVTDVDMKGDRRLVLTHTVIDGRKLHRGTTEKVLKHLSTLWGYPVRLIERESGNGKQIEAFDQEAA